MLKKPVILHQYDDDGKIIKEYKLVLIPWGMMKRVMSTAATFEKIKGENLGPVVDEMTKLLCDIFGGRFTPEEIDKHFDLNEVSEAMTIIIAEAGIKSPNSPAGPKQ